MLLSPEHPISLTKHLLTTAGHVLQLGVKPVPTLAPVPQAPMKTLTTVRYRTDGYCVWLGGGKELGGLCWSALPLPTPRACFSLPR
jgi:hypothetical protein